MNNFALTVALLFLASGCTKEVADVADTAVARDTVGLWTTCTPEAPCGTCDPAGTGKAVGDVVGDISWTADDGSQLSLHAACGKRKAVILVETAAWCVVCTERAGILKQWYDFYKPYGVDLVFVVGENLNGVPATKGDAAKYRTDHAFEAGIGVVSDPAWDKIQKAVQHAPGIGALPLFEVFDSDMKLRYIGDGGDKLTFPDVTKLISEIVGEPFVPTAGCAGSCGKLAPDGCWCDQFCVELGNCCPDNCGVCGNCFD